MSPLEEMMVQDGVLAFVASEENHAVAHQLCRDRNLTATYAAWHPVPAYRVFRTGSLLSDNDKYPSGLVIIDDNGIPHPWTP